MKPRNTVLIGILFLAIATLYWLAPTILEPARVDFAGLTMLIALAASMVLMAYVLVAGSQRH
jgi:amino acid transporter